MKVLWIVNSVLNKLSLYLYNKQSNGVWMDALLRDFQNRSEYSVIVATTLRIKERVRFTDGNITYYALPNDYPILYNENDRQNITEWQKLFTEEKPDLIQIWGTEFTQGLCALRQANNIPSVIYMQGYLSSIARHYLAGMTHRDVVKNTTFRDIVKRDNIEQQQKKYFCSAEKEKEMLKLSGNIICENDWCENSIRSIVPTIKAYRCPLSINSVFSQKEWNIEKAEKHSLICTASGYPLKGLHMVLRAVALLKKDYHDIKLYVPGDKMVSDGSLQWLLRKRGYTQYIEKLVKELDLKDNIIWMGMISQEKLAEQYSKTRAFVLSSSIENHSSSLKEAMMVGVPSVASYVGGVPEYVHHGENGFLYRFEEYEIMAEYIKQIFEDDVIAAKLSSAGKASMKKLHGESEIFGVINNIYKSILE